MTPDEIASLITSRSASAPCTSSSSEMAGSPGKNLWARLHRARRSTDDLSARSQLCTSTDREQGAACQHRQLSTRQADSNSSSQISRLRAATSPECRNNSPTFPKPASKPARHHRRRRTALRRRLLSGVQQPERWVFLDLAAMGLRIRQSGAAVATVLSGRSTRSGDSIWRTRRPGGDLNRVAV